MPRITTFGRAIQREPTFSVKLREILGFLFLILNGTLSMTKVTEGSGFQYESRSLESLGT